MFIGVIHYLYLKMKSPEVVISYDEYIEGKTPERVLLEEYEIVGNVNRYEESGIIIDHTINKNGNIILSKIVPNAIGYQNPIQEPNLIYKQINDYHGTIAKILVKKRITNNYCIVIRIKSNRGFYVHSEIINELLLDLVDYCIEENNEYFYLTLFFETLYDAQEVYKNEEYLEFIQKRLILFRDEYLINLKAITGIKKEHLGERRIEESVDKQIYRSERVTIILQSIIYENYNGYIS